MILRIFPGITSIMKKMMRLSRNFILSLLIIGSSPFVTQAANFYIGAGGGIDVPVNKGYDSPGSTRDLRFDFRGEVGLSNLVFPLQYSYKQDVSILGFKPRMQFLFPLFDDFLRIGPGVGGVVNYWFSDFTIGTDKVSTNVIELGVQASLQAQIKITHSLMILLTPAAFDMNFWRHRWTGDMLDPNGNFSLTDKNFGLIYSAGIGLAIYL